MFIRMDVIIISNEFRSINMTPEMCATEIENRKFIPVVSSLENNQELLDYWDNHWEQILNTLNTCEMSQTKISKFPNDKLIKHIILVHVIKI